MALDPMTQQILEMMKQSPLCVPPFTVANARVTDDMPMPFPKAEIAEVRDLTLSAGGRSLPARLYHPIPGERLPVDAVATSAEWGAAKPSAEFFARVVELGGTAPGRTVYVGDHPAYDAIPAKRAGLRTAHIRRGPWGPLWADDPATIASADWRIDSLLDLVPLLTG